jgi:hypothetical protein
MKDKQDQKLADILFPTDDQIQLTESILDIPPEQRRLHTESYDFTVSTLVSYLKDKKLTIPEFQRRYVWSDAQASRLIESLIIQCPIPVIYLSQQKDESLAVIDGNQRLRSLQRFVNNEFPLAGLTAYPELDGLAFYQLDSRFQRHIENRTIRCLVILKDTHPQVKFDVFERLNTGAVKLTAQELRHGIYHGDMIKLAEGLAKSKDFAGLIEIKHNKRMKLEELVLRYIAFRFFLSSYKKPLASFLNTVCDSNRVLDDDGRSKYMTDFESAVKTAALLYGDHAFKIFDAERRVLSSFNAALYDAELVAAGVMATARRKLPARDRVLNSVYGLINSDMSFRKAVTQATSDDAQVKLRIETMIRTIEAL